MAAGIGVQAAYAAVAGVTTTSGGAIAVARGVFANDTTSGTFVALPGARLTMRGKGLLLIRFTAESNCSGGTWEGNAMDRSIKVGPGLHTIQLEYATTNAGNTDFRLDDWSLTAERAIA